MDQSQVPVTGTENAQPAQPEKANKKNKKNKKNKLSPIMLVLSILAVLGIGASVFFYTQYKDAESQTPEGVAARNAEESATVVNSLGNVLALDTEAEPTVARVEDPETLKEANPDFYADVKVGDYLVLYPSRAIIYRLAESRIINVAPIINTANLNTDSSAADEDTDQTTSTEADSTE